MQQTEDDNYEKNKLYPLPERAFMELTNKKNEAEVDPVDEQRVFSGAKKKLVSGICMLMSIYCLLFSLRIFDNIGYFIPLISHVAIFLAFLLTIGFLLLPATKNEKKGQLPWYDVVWIFLSTPSLVYMFLTYSQNAERYTFMEFTELEIFMGVMTILGVLEITRRALGMAMPIVALVFAGIMFFGNNFSGSFKIRPISIEEAVANLIYHNVGILGVAMETAASIIVMFVIFSSLLFILGGGEFFIKLATGMVGRYRGGQAKIAVLASAFMGMMSGSTTANVASTGVLTIPMMKKAGFTPEYAGAVEAVSSNGGQIMPPIMGLVAFVMADWLGISYWTLATCAIIPAVFYFAAVLIMVDCESRRLNIKGVPPELLPSVLGTVKEGWYYILPIASLIYFLGVLRYSAEASVINAIGCLMAVYLIKEFNDIRKKVTTIKEFLQEFKAIMEKALESSAVGMLKPGIACACAGIIIGSLSVTQIGLVIADSLVSIAGSSQILLLLMAAFACFIFGMGMSSLPAYMIVAIFVVPALAKFGIPNLASHFFIFWFAITSFITPPVALGSFVAAGIAGGRPFETALYSTKIGFCSFTLPFLFVYNPALLLMGSPVETIMAIVTGMIGVTFISFGLSGYAMSKSTYVERAVFVLCGMFLSFFNDWHTIIPIIIGSTILFLQKKRHQATT